MSNPEPRRVSPSANWLWTRAVIAVVLAARTSLPADDGKPKPAGADSKVAAGPPLFDLHIIDPDGKPVSGAKVNLSTQPPIEKVHIKAGKLLNKPRFGVNLISDVDGHVSVECPDALQSFNFRIHKPGFGFYWSTGDSRRKAGAALTPVTVRLERAWTIGGIVVDRDGKPVPNARVLLTIRFAGAGFNGPADRLWTNSKGIWKFESVPQSMSQVTAEVSESKYMTANSTLSRDEFEIKPGHEPAGKITLKSGFNVTGKITDEDGKPIAKALVRTRVGNDTRTAFTGKNGVYRLEGCDSGSTRIVASAKGHAPDFQQVEIASTMAPVDFRLKAGNTLRVRVLDEHGHPVPKATVYFQAWRGNFDYFQFDQAPRETDTDGLWEWHEAPADELTASISRPKGMTVNNKMLIARKEEYVFRVPLALVISGKVVDAETKQPIKKFRVLPGYRWMGQQILLNRNDAVETGDGRYQLRETNEQWSYLLRVESEGYLHAVSREITGEEGKVTVDFELLKGKEFTATVLTPEGAPAVGAKISVLGRGQAVVLNYQCDLLIGQETDKSGKARLEAKNDNFWIMATHPSGCADLAGLPASNPRVITLTPWARIAGTFQAAREPEAHVGISLFRNSFAQDAPRIAMQTEQQTDNRGRFTFERILPGHYALSSIRRTHNGDSEPTSSVSISVNCAPGKTTHVDIGAGGRPVIGQLRRPDAHPDLELKSANIYVYQEGNGWPVDQQVNFNARPDAKGNFAIDDMPPGNYFLNVWISGNRPFQMQSHRFTVPKVHAKLSQRPVDLGVLTMEAAKNQ